MLTAYQCERVAYLGDGDVYCRSCAVRFYEEAEGGEPDGLDSMTWAEDDAAIEAAAGLTPLIRYTVDEEWPGGLWCGECGEVIAEPAEDYCSAHDSWKITDSGRKCEYADGHPGIGDERDPCWFAGGEE